MSQNTDVNYIIKLSDEVLHLRWTLESDIGDLDTDDLAKRIKDRHEQVVFRMQKLESRLPEFLHDQVVEKLNGPL